MKVMRLFAAMMFLTLATSLNSFGYSILCQGSPHSGTFSNVLAPMFMCAIPANAVPVGKSIRVTTAMHNTSNVSKLDSAVVFNGAQALDVGIASVDNVEQGYNFIITNIGGTGWWVSGQDFYGGINANIFGPQDKLPVAVPWSSGWTLAIEVSSQSGTITASGDTFIVEILD